MRPPPRRAGSTRLLAAEPSKRRPEERETKTHGDWHRNQNRKISLRRGRRAARGTGAEVARDAAAHGDDPRADGQSQNQVRAGWPSSCASPGRRARRLDERVCRPRSTAAEEGQRRRGRRRASAAAGCPTRAAPDGKLRGDAARGGDDGRDATPGAGRRAAVTDRGGGAAGRSSARWRASISARLGAGEALEVAAVVRGRLARSRRGGDNTRRG